MVTLKKRQRDIIRALQELGGIATTKAIAEKTNLHTNGVAHSLGALSEKYVRYIDGKAGAARWQLLPKAF